MLMLERVVQQDHGIQHLLIAGGVDEIGCPYGVAGRHKGVLPTANEETDLPPHSHVSGTLFDGACWTSGRLD